MNRVQLVGYVDGEPISFDANNFPAIRLFVACQRSGRGPRKFDSIPCIAFGASRDKIEAMAKKNSGLNGSLVSLEGEMRFGWNYNEGTKQYHLNDAVLIGNMDFWDLKKLENFRGGRYNNESLSTIVTAEDEKGDEPNGNDSERVPE